MEDACALQQPGRQQSIVAATAARPTGGLLPSPVCKHMFAMLCMVAASACATPNPQQLAKQAQPMTATTATSASANLNAEQVLTRLLGVIRDSNSTREITSKHVGREMGVEFLTEEPGYYVFGGELAQGWGYGVA
jgi:hypothetical protein